MKREDDRTLYIAFDESNHGRWPEIIPGIASLIKADTNIIQMNRRERMSEGELVRFLKNEQRDYAYVKVEKGQLPRGRNQLVEVAPYLIDKLLANKKKEYAGIDSINLIFDGELMTRDSNELIYCIRRMKRTRKIIAITFSYNFYPKNKKEYDYPRILIAADSFAHFLFRNVYFREKIDAEKRVATL